jgi:hypothetical protein
MDSRVVGEEFELRDVPYVQYFTDGYALHAAYWHDVFGQPKSHGCINLAPEDARRLFFWTGPQVPPASQPGKFNSTKTTPLMAMPPLPPEVGLATAQLPAPSGPGGSGVYGPPGFPKPGTSGVFPAPGAPQGPGFGPPGMPGIKTSSANLTQVGMPPMMGQPMGAPPMMGQPMGGQYGAPTPAWRALRSGTSTARPVIARCGRATHSPRLRPWP